MTPFALLGRAFRLALRHPGAGGHAASRRPPARTDRHHRAVAFAALAACALLAGCGSRTAGPDEAAASAPAEVQVLSSLIKSGPHGGRSIVGALRNNSATPFQYVQIEFELYDKGGHAIGTTIAKTRNLAPGRDWDFEAPLRQKSAATFKIDDTAHY